MNTQGHWFRSTRFEIEPGEDDEINPGIYGKQLAEWLKARLEDQGYASAFSLVSLRDLR